jgi:2,4-dienoyl-CoA reductase-like NADH-dependent reductase (Old Yellow Enzyme family)
MGIPESFEGRYEYGFGVNPENPSQYDLSEGLQFIELLLKLGIRLVNVTAGSPYYVPHIQRPALFPPSDGYSPPEDPLIGVQRLLNAAQVVKRKFPEAIVVGTGFTYLQEYLPHVAQAVVREGWMDFAGLGRMVLAYPELPFDCLTKGSLDRRRICRTFSDCTTGPRKGLVSGCYPLDPFYKESEMGNQLKRLK